MIEVQLKTAAGDGRCASSPAAACRRGGPPAHR